jgi:DNA repair/transcription protein MET18/MMS19
MEDSGPIRDSVLQQIALIINKFLDDKELYWGTEILWAPSTGLLENPKLSERSLRTVFWIAKALLLRLANTQDILHSLLNLLTNPIFGSTAARGFTLILAPDEILCKDNGAIIRLLVKQKIFNICVPAIAGAFQAAIPAVKSNYLVALSGILKYITTEVLLTEVETLLPLLLQSLDLENQDVKSATIETLIIIVQESTTAVEEHVSSLIGRLLSAAANPVANSPVSLQSVFTPTA